MILPPLVIVAAALPPPVVLVPTTFSIVIGPPALAVAAIGRGWWGGGSIAGGLVGATAGAAVAHYRHRATGLRATPRLPRPAVEPARAPSTQGAVDQRIGTLQAQLGVTEAQLPLWSAFAQAMRDNAATTDALFTQRAASVSAMRAIDNMHSYAQIARAYPDNTERLATAFDSLYASLTETQKQAVDTLFRQQATAAPQPLTRR